VDDRRPMPTGGEVEGVILIYQVRRSVPKLN
jgi:hypothetical protein